MSCGITTKEARIVGEDHLKLILQVPGKDGGLDAIAFRQGKHLDLVRNGTFSLLYTLEENEWNGRRSLQLNVKDIKPGVGDPHGHGAARSEGPAFAAI